jgi:hypothetical protein
VIYCTNGVFLCTGLIDGVVATRISKMTYGIRCSTLFKGHSPAHVARSSQRFSGNDGKVRLPSSFGAILHKVSHFLLNIRIIHADRIILSLCQGESGKEDHEFIESFTVTWRVQVPAYKDVSLFVYRGDEEKAPEFVDEGGL